MSESTGKPELFPTIGSLVEKTKETEEKQVVTDSAEAEEKPVQEVESLCMKCGEQGVTRLMLTSIPYFREVIVMSFRCEHCGATNNEIQSAGTIQPEGTQYVAKILDRSDLNRQIVRSSTCEITIPEYQLTLPATARGQLTTVEGLIRDMISDLGMDQPLRRVRDEEGYSKIQTLLDKLRLIVPDEDEDVQVDKMVAHRKDVPMPPFTVKLDDPAGNSWIEFIGSMSDPKWSMKMYNRTFDQNVALGLVSEEQQKQDAQSMTVQQTNMTASDVQSLTPQEISDDEVFVFPGRCSSCGHAVNTLMKKVVIPYFKDILIMSTNCEHCGYRDNEVKSGAAISEKGKRITLKVQDREDLSRDILKSETAGLSIPEINLVLTHGTLGGRFTTLEGILDQVYEQLADKAIAGDSSSPEDKESFENFLKKLQEVKNVDVPFTVILDDPLANSYLQNLYAPDPDPNMTMELYDRTWEQNEELGLNDIKVENYEQEDDAREKDGRKEDKSS